MQIGTGAVLVVESRWKEKVVYWEGSEGFVFDAGWGVDRSILYVPYPEDWDALTAPWMSGRRDEIVERLRRHSRHRIDPGPYTAPGHLVTR